MNEADIISKFVETVSKNMLSFASAMAAVGVLSMAIIQTLKDMLPLRNWFQQRYLLDWLTRKAGEAEGNSVPRPDVGIALRDLVRLATAGDGKALYDLQIEQMCGQMNAAMQVVLDYPAEHSDLLRCMAALARPSDIEELLKAGQRQKTPEQVDARTRVMHQVQRAIDAFQITAAYRWKLYLQIASFALSFAFTVAGLTLYGGTAAYTTHNALVVVAVGIVGGFLAPVARDLVAALQRLRP
jgi:hypothetical protein